MSDTDRKATLQYERPWTPGPWQPYNFDWRSIESAQDGRTIADVRYRPDGDLIALAPDMADAILAFNRHRLERCECVEDYDRLTYHCPSCKSIESLIELGDALRAIGATDA